MKVCESLTSEDPSAAEERLLHFAGPHAITMPKDNLEVHVWTTSIKVATKLIGMPVRYQYVETVRMNGKPIHKFYSLDSHSLVHEVVNQVRHENLRLNPIHHEILLH